MRKKYRGKRYRETEAGCLGCLICVIVIFIIIGIIGSLFFNSTSKHVTTNTVSSVSISSTIKVATVSTQNTQIVNISHTAPQSNETTPTPATNAEINTSYARLHTAPNSSPNTYYGCGDLNYEQPVEVLKTRQGEHHDYDYVELQEGKSNYYGYIYDEYITTT